MKRTLLVLSLLAAASSSACQITDVQVTPGVARGSLEGSVAGDNYDPEGGLLSSTLDELGVGARQSIAQVGVKLTDGDTHWDLFAQRADFSGSGELAANLTLDGVELDSNEGDVSTDLQMGLYGIRWLKHVSSQGQLDVSLGASLFIADLDLEFQQDHEPDPGYPSGEVKSARREGILPFPLPAIDLVYDHEDFDAHFLLSGMKVWSGKASGHVVDLDFSLSFPVLDDLGELVVGYRELELELEYSGEERAEIDVSLNGLYLGYRMSF
jgi:hypothetical protein